MNLFKRLLGKCGRFTISINLFKLPVIGEKIEKFLAGENRKEIETLTPKKELPKEYTEVFKQIEDVLNRIARKR